MFVLGLVFIVISMFKICEVIVNVILMLFKFVIGGGIGLFFVLIVLKNVGVIVDNLVILVGLGDLK